jgi:hypothetical protein
MPIISSTLGESPSKVSVSAGTLTQFWGAL